MRTEITFQFQSMDDLWAFRIEALLSYIDMDKQTCTLTCSCSHEHILLAVKKYGASVIVRPAASLQNQ